MVKRCKRGDEFKAPMPREARISVTVARFSQKLLNGASVATTYEAQGSKVIRMRMTVAQIDLRTGVANSDPRATFAHRHGRSRKFSSSWVGLACHSRAQAWQIAHIRLKERPNRASVATSRSRICVTLAPRDSRFAPSSRETAREHGRGFPVIPAKGVRDGHSEPGNTRLSTDDGSMASKLPQTNI